MQEKQSFKNVPITFSLISLVSFSKRDMINNIKIYFSIKMKVGITFNLKQHESDKNAIYDNPLTIEAVKQALQNKGYQVKLYEVSSKAFFYNLLLDKPQIVFNMAEGQGVYGEAYVPTILDELKIPYTGSSPLGINLAVNKVILKQVLQSKGLPVPKLYQIIESPFETLQPLKKFPVIVKPIFEGASIGISAKSICYNETEVKTIIHKVFEKIKRPLMIEEFIEGKEITIGVIGNFPPQALPPMEIDFSPLNKKEIKASNGIQTFKFKTSYANKASYFLPARLPQNVLNNLQNLAVEAFRLLNLRDIARFDLRLDQNFLPYLLEVNAIVGLEPEHSDFPRMYRFLGKTYEDLINDILNFALERVKTNQRLSY